MPDGFPSPLDAARLSALFPLERPRLGDDVFELGLVLGGTVSAGAYTAGVLDMLIEVLDVWTTARERGDPRAPSHRVVISTVGGTSGGAINGAILLRAAGWQFPHGADPGNPFYNSWTTGVDLMKLLSTTEDTDIAGLASVLNCSAIDKQADATVQNNGTPLSRSGTPGHRSYLSDPLRLFMMVGNITGIPYRITMRGESGLSHDLVAHADYMRFALTVNGGVANTPAGTWPDEVALLSDNPTNWNLLRDASLATSAFPLAFRSRELRRMAEGLAYRATLIPGETPETAEVAQLIPSWQSLLQGKPTKTTLSSVNVDGGTMNNEPLDVVRTALAGMNGRNKRQGHQADRAVLLIDPFSDPEALGPSEPAGLISMAWPLLNSWIFQARFKPADIALAYAEDVFSRFLIAPVGPQRKDQRSIGQAAIASGGLGGFLGFVDRRFLDYDYRLGRWNAYNFLRTHFSFPENNELFRPPLWTAEQLDAQTVDTTNGVRNIRMIPVLDKDPDHPEWPGVAQPPIPMDWPKLSAMPADLSDAIEQRLQAVYDLAMAEAQSGRKWFQQLLLSSYVGLGWRFYGRAAIRDAALTAIKSGLKKQRLL